jgi:DNA-binding MarR family transcriptional regulator
MVTLVRDTHMDHGAVEKLLDMPFSRFRALRRLERHPRTQRELADLMGVDGSAMSGIVSDLVERGLVTREPSEIDRRCNQIAITAAGRETLDRVRASDTLAPDWFDALDADQRTSLASILDTLVRAQA